MTNATLALNRATASTTGAGLDIAGGSVTVTNATIAFNSGVGLARRAGTAIVRNTVLAGGNDCLAPLAGAAFTYADDNSCGLGAGRDNAPLVFELPAFNGGTTVTMLPQSDNPAIDGGSGATCPATDQRGVARPQGAACDAGAVEYAGEPGDRARVVEYFHSGFGHYFISADPDEILKLDAGLFDGWTRTGLQFNVYTKNADHTLVCRFFTEQFAPKSSHFYAPHGLGCEGTQQNPSGLTKATCSRSTCPMALACVPRERCRSIACITTVKAERPTTASRRTRAYVRRCSQRATSRKAPASASACAARNDDARPGLTGPSTTPPVMARWARSHH